MAAPRFYSPLLYPLAGVIGGIYLQTVFNVAGSYLFAGLLGSLLVSALLTWLHRTRLLVGLFVVSFACLGGLMVSLHHWHNQQLFDALGNEPIQCLATVVDKGEWGNDGKGCLVRVAVHEVFAWMGAPHQFVSFDLLCYSRVPLGVAVGDTVLMRRMVIKQVPALHSDKPGYQAYLAKEGIAAAVFLCGGYQCRTVARPAFSPRRWVWQLRNRVFTALRAKMAPLTASYFGLIFLGNKQQPHNEALREIFCRWGLAHYLARAGLHIVFFIMIWTWLLGLLPLHIQARRLLLIALCVLYDCLSWSSIPFSRAYYAFLLTQFGQWRYRQTNYLHLLTIICLLILAFNPLQLFFLDFQLTFALTFTLVFVAYLSAP
jgi:hypothetical protein